MHLALSRRVQIFTCVASKLVSRIHHEKHVRSETAVYRNELDFSNIPQHLHDGFCKVLWKYFDSQAIPGRFLHSR